DLAVEMHEPYTFLNGLTVADMEDLLEDIQVYMELEQGKNADFWRDMTTITEDEISKLRKLEASGKGPGHRGQNPCWWPQPGHGLLGEPPAAASCPHGAGPVSTGLRERHQDVLRQKLYKLKQEQGVESEP
ncbi:CACTIN isoform 9, partial [Pan troglodytes]